MSRHSSNSSYYQSSSRPESPAPFAASSSSASASAPASNQQHSQYSQQQQQQQQHQHHQQHYQHHQQQLSVPQQQQPPPPPRNQKADQILQNFYVKVIQIVVLARVTHPDPHAAITPKKGSLRGAPLIKKTSKWFNLELEDLDIYKEDAKFWRAAAITDSPPPMLVELLLDTSELSPNQMLVLVDDNNRKNKIDITGPSSTASTPLGQGRTRRNIILESWSLTLSNNPPDPAPEPPVVYKKSIIFFRSLFAYMRLLPAYQLYRRLRKQNYPLKIGFRISRGHMPDESMFRDSEIGIEVPLIEGETRSMLSEYRFGQVETPIGNCEFHVDESEAVLNSRFIDMDENYFTPTIVTHSQESETSMRRPSMDGNILRKSSTSMTRRPSSDVYASGNYPDNFNQIPTLRPRRNSAQSLQQRSGENSSSQSSVSSLGTRMSRRGSSGAPGGLLTPIEHNAGTPPFSLTQGGHALVAKHYVDPITESPPFKLGSSQSGLLGAASKSSGGGGGGGAFATNFAGTPSSIPNAGILSTSAKSNTSSTSAPRVTSSFGHRHDSSGRRSSSESLPPGRGNRTSIIGSSLTPNDDDVNAFVQMLATPEPLKMFGKAGGSGIGQSFGSGDSSLSGSTMKNKSALDRFQQLKQSYANLSESMSASQLMSKDQQQSDNMEPLSSTTGHTHRRSNLSDMGPSSPTSLPFATGTVTNPPTPSPLHTEIPVRPPTSSGRSESQPIHTRTTERPSAADGTPSKRHSWLIGGSSSSGGSNTGVHHDLARKGANMSSIAFRHGSLDQRKDILNMEDAMEQMDITAQNDIAFGSFPEDLHHQHSLYSAPLNTGRDKKGDNLNDSCPFELPFGPDPRPIPSFAGEASTVRVGRISRTGSGSNKLPRLRTRATEDNESLNEMNSADAMNDEHHRRRSLGHGRPDEEDDEVEDDYEDSREIRSGHDGKSGANTSINDDDDMLFTMSELSPGSTSGHDSAGAIVAGAHGRGILPLTGALLNLRSQSQSPSLNSYHGGGGNGGSGTSSSHSPHLRIFGRGNSGSGNGNGNNGNTSNLGSDVGNSSRSNSRSQSRNHSRNHSRVGSNSGSVHNQSSIEMLRQSGSGSGHGDDFNLPSRSSTPPPFPGFVASVGAFEAMLEGRRMSRGNSDRGMGSGIGSGASTGGQNSFHSDSRGGRIEGWFCNEFSKQVSKQISKIKQGLCVLVGLSVDDTSADLDFMVRKLLSVRVFDSNQGVSEDGTSDSPKMWSRSVVDIGGEILCVSQFTLYGQVVKGSKPDFHLSMKSDTSRQMYHEFLDRLKKAYKPDLIKDGEFGAMMLVNIANDGPVTLELDSRKFEYLPVSATPAGKTAKSSPPPKAQGDKNENNNNKQKKGQKQLQKNGIENVSKANPEQTESNVTTEAEAMDTVKSSV
ncbi:autophagy protein 13 [Mortierella sp. AD094]|nr:autophagy protein 13 [Mortierella sp. AD094]